jgi:hypothetical protein
MILATDPKWELQTTEFATLRFLHFGTNGAKIFCSGLQFLQQLHIFTHSLVHRTKIATVLSPARNTAPSHQAHCHTRHTSCSRLLTARLSQRTWNSLHNTICNIPEVHIPSYFWHYKQCNMSRRTTVHPKENNHTKRKLVPVHVIKVRRSWGLATYSAAAKFSGAQGENNNGRPWLYITNLKKYIFVEFPFISH